MVGHGHRGQHLKVVLVAVYEYVVLYEVVAREGIVVHLLQLLRHPCIVLVVFLHVLPHAYDIAAQGHGIVEAGLAVDHSLRVEGKRLLARALVGLATARRLLVRVLAQRGRNGFQSVYKVGVAFYLGIHARHYLVVGHAHLAKLAPLLGGLVAGVGHVKREVLLLRVEHERHLVAALHERNHLLVLHRVILRVARHVLLLLVERRLKLGAQHRERRREVLFLEHRVCPCTHHQHRRQRKHAQRRHYEV